LKGLYIHIPFCESICHYCDFVKRVPRNQEMIDTYISALINEISSYRDHFSSIETIYIGGGTPSMLTISQFKRLFDSLLDIKPLEFTVEVNPESYTDEKGVLFKAYGVNRISLGVQTFNPKLLSYLNRKHTNDHVIHVVNHLKAIEIPMISVDLIYSIPGQTLEDLYKDLEYIQKLDITHVSCYSLILEEKTYFYHQYLRGKFETMDEDTEATMYQIVMDELKKQGFEHYEISNYAKNSHYSKHNLLYWTLGEYIGVGLGAHGLIDNQRTYNHKALPKYLVSPLDKIEIQSSDSLLQDELIFGLRKINGVDVSEIEEKYRIKLLDKYPGLKDKMEIGLVKIEEGRLKLTEKGVFLGNQVFMVFI
jgi:oxygen-independent coproporphyrinogen III oxidase